MNFRIRLINVFTFPLFWLFVGASHGEPIAIEETSAYYDAVSSISVYAPEGTDVLIDKAAAIAPLLPLANERNSDYVLSKSILNDIGIMPENDRERIFSMKGRDRLTPGLGWVSVDMSESGIRILSFKDFMQESEDIWNRMKRHVPNTGASITNVACITFWVHSFGEGEFPETCYLLELDNGTVLALDYSTMDSTYLKRVRVNPEAIDPDIRAEMEAQVFGEEGIPETVNTTPASELIQDPRKPVRFVWIAGIIILVLGGGFWLFRRGGGA